MSHIYKKRNPKKIRTIIKYLGLCISLISLLCLTYIVFPLISWKLYSEPALAYNTIQTPIPKMSVLSANNVQTLLSSAVDSLNVDYSNARNWFPQYRPALESTPPVVTTFNISIPKLGIKYANVTTIDTDLSRHLVLYPGTVIPPNKGNAVIFGHSTIPGWFNPQDYTTIFATVHKLKVEDQIYVTVNAKEYMYRIASITITTPDDTTMFAQDNGGSYLTLITCTPPGTTWKRLVIKAILNVKTD
jgi:sortase A